LFTLAAVTPGIGFVGFAAPIGMFSAQAVAKLKDITEGLLTKIVRGPEHITDTALTVTGVSPSRGPAGTSVKVSGTGFGAGTTVDFGTVPATTVVVVSDKELQATSPAGPAAGTSVDVSVKRGAKAPAVLKGGYTY